MANGKMIPARSAVGSVPPEAKKQGSLNESIPESQKLVPDAEKLDPGPKVDGKGAYLPAAYRTKHGNVRVDR